MATAFYMQKIKEKNGIYYYEVSDWRPEPTEFVVAIDAQKKTVSYFKTVDCKDPITIIDFNIQDGITPVSPYDKYPGLSSFVLAGVQARKALNENCFPDHLGKYS